ncbi:AzlC family ABC transporter permease [Cellulosilyticum sp. I15G10I2]|uniref:AzlC family ABC transporter permease n=1 Tax=Cellulosilyticum sp. I15G10I2 TaxID=1892843 RepID=UPI000A61EB31|nr:AzlC family ABC transporter permease [Cellulosilyticum sp. I15G10I2]
MKGYLGRIVLQNINEEGIKEYIRGVKKGMPIGLGYLYVSIAFGMMAVTGGVLPIQALIISMTNLTSAGQFAGIKLIVHAASFAEIALTVFVINIRYILMSLSLSQRLGANMSQVKKAFIAFGITDEIFTMASLEKQQLTCAFMLGLMTLPYIGWALGTYLGAAATMLLSPLLQDALGIALYAMFIALIIPAARESKAVRITLIIAIGLSCLFKYAPYVNSVSSGFAIIAATILASALAAYLFPVKEEE